MISQFDEKQEEARELIESIIRERTNENGLDVSKLFLGQNEYVKKNDQDKAPVLEPFTVIAEFCRNVAGVTFCDIIDKRIVGNVGGAQHGIIRNMPYTGCCVKDWKNLSGEIDKAYMSLEEIETFIKSYNQKHKNKDIEL